MSITGEVVPNEDASPNNWGGAPVETPHWERLNEDHSSPNTSDYIIATNIGGDNNAQDDLGFTTLTGIQDNSITQIKVYTYGIRAEAQDPEIAVSWDTGSNFTSPEDCQLGDTVNIWTDNTWSGLSYSKSDLDNFQVRYIADVPDKNASNRISTVYAEVTYTETTGAGGYANIVNDVDSADIGKVLGVATADIAKVLGV